jgi:hypothetical protein
MMVRQAARERALDRRAAGQGADDDRQDQGMAGLSRLPQRKDLGLSPHIPREGMSSPTSDKGSTNHGQLTFIS